MSMASLQSSCEGSHAGSPTMEVDGKSDLMSSLKDKQLFGHRGESDLRKYKGYFQM